MSEEINLGRRCFLTAAGAAIAAATARSSEFLDPGIEAFVFTFG